jgi:ABC-2 type transport system permease protein
VDLSGAKLFTAAAVIAAGSARVFGLAIFVAILPLLFTEREAQMTFVLNAGLLLVSGIYYPRDVLSGWLRVAWPIRLASY